MSWEEVPSEQPTPAPASDEFEDLDERYAHLRANVPRRRRAYKFIVLFGILAFAASVVDILALDSAYMLPIVAIYGVLALLAIAMYFSRSVKADAPEPVDVAPEEPERPGRSYDQDIQHNVLSCPNCRNVFRLGLEHFDQRLGVLFTCPECGKAARLPTAQKAPIEAHVPEGPIHEAWFHCEACDDDWSVGTFGHEGRTSHFDACPHCGVEDKILVQRLVEAR